ncbi:hypothetical protein TNCV_1029611 [Trichonephila clavipes]|nr:hypothetical protein TNCV_1029611 [Trichonephila clavipes]
MFDCKPNLKHLIVVVEYIRASNLILLTSADGDGFQNFKPCQVMMRAHKLELPPKTSATPDATKYFGVGDLGSLMKGNRNYPIIGYRYLGAMWGNIRTTYPRVRSHTSLPSELEGISPRLIQLAWG